jgi:hypothetical protein
LSRNNRRGSAGDVAEPCALNTSCPESIAPRRPGGQDSGDLLF